MTTEAAAEEKIETVTFYSWMGTAGRAGEEHACPSSQIIYISGGRRRVGNDGAMVREPVKEAIFSKGKCTTSDPETIASLRRIIARNPGGGLTENVEEFYAATLTPQQRAQRAGVLNQQTTQRNEDLERENQRLRQMLEEAGKAEPPRRKTA